MKLDARGETHTGLVRSENEDRLYCNAELGVFAVADGIGGKPGGQVASQTVVDGVADRAAEFRRFVDARSPLTDEGDRDEIFDYLFEELQSINYEVVQRGSSAKFPRGIGCTVDLVVVVDGGAFVLHVGDSRVYLLRGDKIYRITRDHTFAERLRDQLEDPSQEAANLDHYSNVLTRSIGSTPRVKIDRLFVGLEPGNGLILCTDGITKYMTGADILRHCQQQEELLDVPRALVEEANDQGGGDNSTVVMVIVDEARPFDRQATKHDTFQRVQFLQSVDLFDALELQEVLKILRYVYTLQCNEGSTIISRGEAVDGLYFVMSGKLSVDLGNRHLGELAAGDHFGEIGLFGDSIRSADVQCVQSSELLFMPKDSLKKLVTEDPILGNKLLCRLLASTSEIIQEML